MRVPRTKNSALALPAVVTLLTVALALVSCSRKTIYAHYAQTHIEGWEHSDTLVFSFGPITDAAAYSEQIDLRTCSSYPFKELTLIVEQQVCHEVASFHTGSKSLSAVPASTRPATLRDAPSPTLYSDTIHCRLTDEDGTVLSRGFNFRESSFSLRTIPLQPGDSVALRVHHFMKRELLPGIANIGVSVRKEQ